MSKPLLDILLHAVEADTNTHELAQRLSKLLGVGVNQLEMQLVKLKLSRGAPEALVSGLTKEKAEQYQKLLGSIGLTTSLKEGISLVPLRRTATVNKFTCPACGIKQESKAKEEDQICISCGVVKQKYEEVQGFKKHEQEVIRHNQLLEKREKAHYKKSTQEKYNKQLSRRANNRLKTKKTGKQKLVILLSTVFGFSVVGVVSYLYLEHSNKQVDQLAGNTQTSQKMPITSTNKENKLGSQAITNKNLSDNQFKELGNPYSKFADPVKKKVSAAEGVKKINTLLKNKKLKLPSHDKSALKEISQIYKKVEIQPEKELDYASVLRIANSIKNKNVRNTIKQQASWEEIENGLKTFDELGIHPSIREGEDDPAVVVSNKLMDVYISVNQFEKAVKEAELIKNQYLRAVALNKIMMSVLKEGVTDKTTREARSINNKIKAISKKKRLGIIQRSLISGVLARSEILLGNKKEGEKKLEKTQLSVRKIKKIKDRIVTLIQLSEDQREGLNFKFASLFLEDARKTFKKNRKRIVKKDKIYSLLAKQYANLLDFTYAKKFSKKIRNRKNKILVNQAIAFIETKASANHSKKG